MSDLNIVITDWKREVEEEAIKLIKRGMPPYKAMKQATVIVSTRRARK